MTFEIPGFTPIDVIGRGGFGVVHRAADDAHGREVAVKILARIDDDSARRRFDRERRAMGTLSGHPNIGVVYTSGFTDRSEPYIVMEMIRGGSLADRLDRTGPLPAAEVIELGLALAEALQHAHDGGVLHLDLKPENILMSRFGRPKIVDFGIAALVDDESRSTTIRATPAYADPAVLDGEQGTESSDVYGLAATLFTLLNGSPPYSDGPSGLYQVMRRVALDPVPMVERADVSRELALVLQRAMAKERSGRPGSMNELADGLQRATPMSWSPNDRSAPTQNPLGGQQPEAARPPLPPVVRTDGPSPIIPQRPEPQPAPTPAPIVAAAPQPEGSLPVAPHQHVITPQHPTPSQITPHPGTPQHVTPQHLPQQPPRAPAPRRRGSKAMVVFLSLVALGLGSVLAVLIVQRSDDDTAEAGATDEESVVEPDDQVEAMVDDTPLPDAEIVNGLIVVPDVIGQPTARAELVLENVGLKRTIWPHCNDVVENTDPSPGLQVEPETPVLLIHAPCNVPDFVGLTIDEATEIVVDDIRIGLLISWPDHCAGAEITGQSVAAGTEVEPGTTVELELPTC